MKKISLWAKHHVFVTRIIIAIIHTLLLLIAFYITQHVHFNFSFFQLTIMVLIIITARIIYPFMRKKSYALQKALLFITSTCFFLIVCFAMKNNFILSNNQNVLSAVSLPVDSSANMLNKISSYKEYKALSKSDRKKFRTELKKEISLYKKATDKPQRPSAEDAALIFLIVLCGIGLLSLLSVLVCSISCGGIPGGVILLSLLGMGGIGVGLYFIIRSLHRNVEQERKETGMFRRRKKQNNNLLAIATN